MQFIQHTCTKQNKLVFDEHLGICRSGYVEWLQAGQVTSHSLADIIRIDILKQAKKLIQCESFYVYFTHQCCRKVLDIGRYDNLCICLDSCI